MFLECRHIRAAGDKCKAAALKGQPFCYFHTRERERAGRPLHERYFLQIPRLEDRAAIQIALTELAQAIADDQIDARRAGQLLYCFQIASQNARGAFKTEGRSVREVGKTADGQDLAPSVENYTEDFGKILGDRFGEAFCANVLGIPPGKSAGKPKDPLDEHDDEAHQIGGSAYKHPR
jgi:hypothetical protein